MHDYTDWNSLPIEIRRHIEFCETWEDYPWIQPPTDRDLALADELVLAYEDGCPLKEIMAIWNRYKALTA